MKPQYIYQRAKKLDPTLKLRDVIEMINSGMFEAHEVLGEVAYTTVSSVEDQRFYDLADTLITEIEQVFYMDSDGTYRPIPRWIGRPDTGDQT